MAKFPNPEVLFVTKDVDPTFSQAQANPMMKEWELTTMQLPGGKEPITISIVDGIITPTQSAHIVDTEGQSPSDEIQTISTLSIHEGCIIELLSADQDREVILKHNPSQLNGITLVGGKDKILSTAMAVRLQLYGEFWRERPLGNALSDALDGTRTAADGVGASEWALARVNAKGEEAKTAAEAAQAAAADAGAKADEAAVAAAKTIGVDQRWRDVLSSRQENVIYTNTEAKPIFVSVVFTTISTTLVYVHLIVNGVIASQASLQTIQQVYIGAIVPPGHTYRLEVDGNVILSRWSELQ